ncbi:MAG TPA: protein kinase [Dokdonella sp.]|uniref:protein kinase domain-containing protein n=1 Tax=Dokdonella sp. TaxID=2291710 RepID=UPI002D809399|nr:protein kinase [Dokdonella sp.]HET9031876.1 protein kinase [Dokdonella sp.]
MAIYRAVLPMSAEARKQQLDSLDESVEVRAKLHQLLLASQDEEASAVEEKLDRLVDRLGRSIGSEAEPDLANEVLIGRLIGNWSVIRELGRGGMATVFLVKRNGVDFEQHGALKLLSLLMLAAGGAKRFAREQQLLARMHHPNIAMLLDGGVAEDGTPYLVTERVEGSDLRTYCDEHELAPREVVGLLLQVCAAVSHAHGNLILHRDIKPSNVMVTTDGQVKLLDFGIGKLTEDAADGTQTRVFTPKYAAPEQLSGGAVTTATDVFGLGALGRTLLSTSVSDHRELDRIFDMATHDEASRRYGSVESLARDLRNWLDNRPIVAVADSPGYRARKYLRRHRGGVAAAAAILLTAVVGLSLVLWQTRQTREQLAISERTTQFLVQLFELADPAVAHGSPTTARDLLKRARNSLTTISDDTVRDRLVVAIAQAYHGMADFAEARQVLLEDLSRSLNQQPVDARLLLAESTFSIGQASEAIHLLEDVDAAPADAFRLHGTLGHFLSSDGQFKRADEEFAKARALANDASSAEDVLEVLKNSARNDIHQGRYAQVLTTLNEALDLSQVAQLPLAEGQIEQLLAQVANVQGSFADALVHVDSARTLLGKVYSEDHSIMLELSREEADTLRNSGQNALAVEKLEHAVELARTHLGDSTVTTDLLNFLSMAYKSNGQLDSAIATGMETSETLIRMGDGRNPIRANVLGNVASYQTDLGQLDAAQNNVTVAQAILAESMPLEHPLSIFVAYQAQRIVIRRGQFEAALDRLSELAPMALDSPGPGNGLTLWILSSAGRQSLRLGRIDTALDWFGQAREATRARGEDSERYLAATADLAEAMLAAGRADEAQGLLDSVLATRASVSPELEASLRLREAQFARQRGDSDLAKVFLQSALDLMPEGSMLRAEWAPEIAALSTLGSS